MADQTEEKGSVILPAAIGLGAGYAAKRHYDGQANKLVSDAIAGAEGVKQELVQGAKAAIGDGAVGTMVLRLLATWALKYLALPLQKRLRQAKATLLKCAALMVNSQLLMG